MLMMGDIPDRNGTMFDMWVFCITFYSSILSAEITCFYWVVSRSSLTHGCEYTFEIHCWMIVLLFTAAFKGFKRFRPELPRRRRTCMETNITTVLQNLNFCLCSIIILGRVTCRIFIKAILCWQHSKDKRNQLCKYRTVLIRFSTW